MALRGCFFAERQKFDLQIPLSCGIITRNEQISNAFVRLHKPFRQKSTILMVDFCHLP